MDNHPPITDRIERVAPHPQRLANQGHEALQKKASATRGKNGMDKERQP